MKAPRRKTTQEQGETILADFVRYAIYVRVSLLRQVEEGDSVETQETLAREIADKTNGVVYKVYIDPGISASKTDMEDRPALMEMLQDAKDGRFDAVIAFKRDRLARHPVHAGRIREALKKAKVKLIFSAPGEMQAQANDPMGDYIEGILALNNAFESAVISQRVTSVMLNKAKKGEWSGGTVPFGYRHDKETKTFITVPEEIAIVHEVERLYLNGMGETGITKWLNGEEVRGFGIRAAGPAHKLTNRKGNVSAHWTREQVRWIIGNPWYCGYVTYNKATKSGDTGRFRDADEWVQVKGTHEAVRTEERHQDIQRLREQRLEGMSSPRFYTTEFMLTGLLYCKACGTPVGTRNTTKGKTGKHYAYYACHTKSNRPGHSKCNLPIYQKELAEEFIIAQVVEYAESLDISALTAALDSSKRKTSAFSVEQLRSVEREIADLEERRKSNMASYETETDADFKAELKERQIEIRNALTAARERRVTLEQHLSTEQDDYFTLRRVYDLLKQLPEAIKAAPLSMRKALLAQVIDRIELHESGKADITFKVTQPEVKPEVSAFGVQGNPQTLKKLTITLPLGETASANINMWAHVQHSKAASRFKYWVRREGSRLLGGKASGGAIAKLLGIGQPQVNRYFKGLMPTKERFEHICATYGLSPMTVYASWELAMTYETFFDMVHSPKRQKPPDAVLYSDREKNNEKGRKYKERRRLGLVDTSRPAPGRKAAQA